MATDGLCECGCGNPAPVSTETNRKYGWVKGQPKRFIRGHANKGKTWTTGRRTNHPPPNPDGVCMCGCGAETPRASYTSAPRGWVAGEHLPFIHGHNRRKPMLHAVDPDTGCWVWLRSAESGRYGTFMVDRQSLLAHRWSYEKHKGPIPEGFHIHHQCENPACINPDHLEALSPADHRRAHAKDAA